MRSSHRRFSGDRRRRQPPEPLSLVESARQGGGKLGKHRRAFLGDLDACLQRRKRGTVAILVDRESSALGQLVEGSYPRARVHTVDVRPSDSALHARLAAHGPYMVIVDDTGPKTNGVELFRNTFFHLSPRGVFVVRNLRPRTKSDESLWLHLSRLIDGRGRRGRAPKRWPRHDQSLSGAIGRVVLEGHHLLVTNRVRSLAKMREAEMNTVLALRSGKSGKVLETRPPVEFRFRCTLRESAEDRGLHMPDTYHVPELSLREYHNVICTRGQVAIQGNLLLPDTYRHNQYVSLGNRFTTNLSSGFAEPLQDVSRPGRLAGAYFHLDSEWPGHFGHSMTEQMSRLWAWDHAKRQEPDLKALLALRPGRTELTDFEAGIFGAVGIDTSDVVLIDRPVEVEKLIAATPMFSHPDYVHPDITATWTTIGRSLASSAPAREYPKRIFCSRRLSRRLCHNVTDVEAVFAGHGFEVIYPEDFPFAEQAAMFRHAEVVAGFAGSALFSLCFCESPKRVIMISSESYTARNEYMIASVLGHEIDVVWCKPDRPQAGNRRRMKTFLSGFTVDFDREGLYLKQILTSL